MSAVPSRPTSIANSFYESEGRPSIEPTNKTRELARAIGRERQNQAPSFRPPSSWTQRSSHHDVVWTGDQGQTPDPNDDQFSDAESWDGDTQAGSHAATIGGHDPTASVYGHVRPTSIGSSIFAGRGAKSNARRREAPPPLPNMSTSSQYHQHNQHLGGDVAGLLSPSAQSMPSPRSDASGFESSSQYSGYDGKDDQADGTDLVDGFNMQPAAQKTRTPKITTDDDKVEDDTFEADRSTRSVPSRNSSRMPPPLPIKAASRNSNESQHRDASTEGTSPNPSAGSLTKSSPARLADGTIVPKMPPVPQTSDLLRPRRAKARRDHSPILSFDGGAAEEERMLVALQDKLASDARRISTLGPKVKKNAPAPWELGGEDVSSSAGRPSLRETLRPSAETFEKPFSRFKSRPSVESSHNGGRSPNPPHVPSGLALSSHPSNADSLEQEALKEDDATSVFATQRSRSKSVSSSAVGMLKGLGLAGAAAPASKKGKLTKALRLVGGGGSNDERRPAHATSAPLQELPAATNLHHAGSSPVPPMGFTADLPQSRSSRGINNGNFMPPVTKSQAELANMIMSTNAKFRDQARSPPIPSPKHANGTLPSPRMGGVRSLAYKKDTLSPTDSISFASEQGQRSSSFSLEQSRSRTPPMREVSITSRSEVSGENSTRRTSSLEEENRVGSTQAEDESTPVGKVTPEAIAAARGQTGSTGAPQAGIMSTSSSQTSGSLPLPGNIEGVPYKLISLEQAREQARQKQSEWLASSGSSNAPKTSPYLAAGESNHDEVAMSRDLSSDGGQSSMRLLKNKKSGFLLRKLKKEKGVSVDYDGVSTFPQSGSSKDLARSSKSPMPSFSLQDEESDQLKPLVMAEKPALQIRPVSSMFSGFAADFLDASALSEGHLREASGGSTASSTGLLAPHSPATPSPIISESGRFASTPSSPYKPKLAEIRATPHGTVLPGPRVPDSADSNWSGHGGASGASRLPSLDAGASNSDTQSQFHSPINSPLTPSFHHSVHPPPNDASSEAAETVAAGALSPPASPQIPIPEEVRQRAREIEAQIQELSNELHDLRVKHVGQGIAPNFKPAEVVGEKERSAVGDCPACGCGCAEQRRLQSINEAAVLKGISVLDRGRALKPSSNMGNTGKFGGYTNR